MYALGIATRDIQGHLQDLYGVDVSAALISEVTDSILEEVKAWQDRPLDADGLARKSPAGVELANERSEAVHSNPNQKSLIRQELQRNSEWCCRATRGLSN